MSTNAATLQQGALLWFRVSVVVLVAVAVGWPAAAQNVIDGDTIELDGATYQLYGIDAPEPAQICADGWPAGLEAEAYLGKLIEGKEVSCTGILRERSGMLAICRADGNDLGSAMVTGGYAFAFISSSARYIAQEEAATVTRRGLHAHPCLAPWKWRSRLTTDGR